MKTSYAPEEKQALIDRYLSNKEPVGKLLASAGVPRSTFYGWLQAYREVQQFKNRKSIDPRNFRILENKVARLEGIIEILRQSPCTLQAPLKERLAFAEQIYGKYSIHMICEALAIDRGTFYNHVLRNNATMLGMQNVEKNCGFVSERSMMKTDRSLVLQRLQQFFETKAYV